jgi:hypothetical protein
MDSRNFNDIQYAWLLKHDHPDIVHAGWGYAFDRDAIRVSLHVRGKTGGERSASRQISGLDLQLKTPTEVITEAMDDMYAQLVEGIETYG